MKILTQTCEVIRVGEILLPEQIKDMKHLVIDAASSQFYRDGILLEKGCVLSEKRIENQMELYKKYCNYWSAYPDKFLELITPSTSKFRLKFFQVLFLRACLRHGRILTVAPRAAGKSFICILALILICMFRPRSRVFLCSPGKA